MSERLRMAIHEEWEQARRATVAGEPGRAFTHLERAHILSQRLTLLHVRTHLKMLAWGWRQRDAREVVGQMSRTVAAACFSRIWVPLGNTGGAKVSALQPMTVPDDLKDFLA